MGADQQGGRPAASGGRFGRQHRLTQPAEFKRVFSSQRRSKDQHFTVIARANGKMQARLGLAVPKKALRLAVLRNRMKRLIRESFRAHQQRLAGLDIVVLARRHDKVNNADIRRSLLRHWEGMPRCKD